MNHRPPHTLAVRSATLTLLLLLLCLTPQATIAQMRPNTEWIVAAYNVENLFSPNIDSVNPDTDFTPNGPNQWTSYRMHRKIHRIAQALYTLTQHHPIGLLGLSEIEDSHVLNLLAQHALMRRHKLEILHRDSPDPRGIDVALLYNPAFASVVSVQWLYPDTARYKIRTREMLHATFKVVGADTLHVIQCHWPSKRRGGNEQARTVVALLLRQILDEIKEKPHHEFIVMGDFNEEYPSRTFNTVVSATDSARCDKQHTIHLPLHEDQDAAKLGSYKFKGHWRSIDHFFISSGLLKRKNRISADSTHRIGNHPSLLEEDTRESGMRPMRMMLGPRFRPNGTSDHLPIAFNLRINAPHLPHLDSTNAIR